MVVSSRDTFLPTPRPAPTLNSVMHLLFCGFLYLTIPHSVLVGKELAIERARVQQAEDGPTVPSNFRFLPGEAVYLSFRVAGYETVEKEDEKRFVSITYKVEVMDQAGVPLVAAATGKIENEVLAEDRDWLPKVAFTFELPQRIAGGTYKMVATVTDEVAKSKTGAELPLRVDGPVPPDSKEFAISGVRFFRQESDKSPLQVAAYRPGEPIWIRFVISGYQLAPENRLHVEYGVVVTDPAGKVMVNQPEAAKDTYSSFYPCRTVPGLVNLSLTGNVATGAYKVTLLARDKVGNQAVEHVTEFSLE